MPHQIKIHQNIHIYMGKPNIEKVKQIQEKGKAWMANYKKFDLSSDSEAAKQYKEMTLVLDKCSQILEKESKKSVSKDEIGSIAISDKAKKIRAAELQKQDEIKAISKETVKKVKNQIKNLKSSDKRAATDLEKLEDAINQYKNLAISFLDAGLTDIINGIVKLDKGLVKKVQGLISRAEAFLNLAKLVAPEDLTDEIKNVETWLASAKKVLEMVNSIDKYLKLWRDISVEWMEKGIKDVVKGLKIIGKINNAVASDAISFKKTIENFIAEAKKFGDKSLDDKLKKAEEWLQMTNTVLDKAGDLVDNIFKDADKNSLPDWFDLLSKEWEKFSSADLVPGKLDEALIAKINIFKAKVEEWLKKATAEISPAIKDKIATAKMWVSNIQKLIDITQKGKEFIDDLKNKDFNAVYEKLKSLWNGIDSTNDIFAGTDIDNKLLDKIKELKSKAENFASIANSLIKQFPGGDKLGDVESWIKKAVEIAGDMARGEDVVANYLKLAKEWAEGEIKKVVDGAKEVTAEVAGQISGFVNEVKKFMAGASSLKKGDFADKIAAAGEWIKSSESILDKATQIIDLVLGDADKNNLPDWYDKLSKSWDKILGGKDLIPGMDFDDALIGKLNVFKAEAEKWLAKAVGMESELKEKIENVRQWIDTGANFLKEVAGFVKDIKEGDLLSVYEKIKAAGKKLENTDDILKGTNIDNKFLDWLKGVKSDAESWIANKLTGGKAKGEMTEDVKNILSLADDILTFVLTKDKVEDYSHLYQEDLIVITDPQGRELNKAQVDDLIGEFSGGIDGSVKIQLNKVIDKIAQEMISLGLEIDAAYRKTVANGSGAAQVFLDAKKSFDAAMKKQKQAENIVSSLRDVLSGIIVAALTPVNPGIAAAVGGLLSGALTDYTKLASFLGKTAAEHNTGTLGKIGGFVSGILSEVDNSTMTAAESSGLVDLNNLFNKGVTHKYEEVKSFVSKLKAELDNIYKNLYKITDDALDNTKSSVAGAADKWKNLNGQIQDKYINAKTTRINQNVGLRLFSRANYANWLSGRKDTMIVDGVITALEKLNIMKEAGVEWDKGVGGDIAKSLGSFFGGWASFGYDKKVKSLSKWANDELGALSKDTAWAPAFS